MNIMSDPIMSPNNEGLNLLLNKSIFPLSLIQVMFMIVTITFTVCLLFPDYMCISDY